MAQHLFEKMRPEYEAWLASAKLLPGIERQAKLAAQKLYRNIADYRAVEKATGVPAIVTMPINMRESSGNMQTFLGNGQSLLHTTTIVPKGFGPFLKKDGTGDWAAGAIAAIRHDKLNRVASMPGGWTGPRALFEWEGYNGFGFRDYHKHRSTYIVAGTNLQQRGKYKSDGDWDGNLWDPQLGTLAIARALVDIDKTLAIPGLVPGIVAPAAQAVEPDDMPEPHVSGVVEGHDTAWVQRSLNELGYGPLGSGPNRGEDNIYGRLTRMAVRQFQTDHHPPLKVDGIAGEKTQHAIAEALSEKAHDDKPVEQQVAEDNNRPGSA